MSSLAHNECVSASPRFLRPSLLLRVLSRRRFARLEVESLPVGLLRDLGFADGHAVPPRDALRD